MKRKPGATARGDALSSATRGVALACAAALTAALSGCGNGEQPSSDRVAEQSCGTVSARFEPDGEGAAVKIRARGVGCRVAKRVTLECLHGRRTGWDWRDSEESRDPVYGPRGTMRNGAASISFSIVGGGGCAAP